MAITHATSTGPIGETQWLENHTVDGAALRAALNVADGATTNASDAALRDRETHTGNQAISTVSGLQDALDGKLADADLDTLAKLNTLIADATLLASSAFATVATSGAYSDLTGTPSIPAALTHLDTTVTGTELNADHAKLILIENGATSDQSAAEVQVSLTATNYTASTADVEAHLTGINTALGSVGTVEGATNALTITGSNGIEVDATSTGANAATVDISINQLGTYSETPDTLTSTAGALTIPLDGKTYTVIVTEDTAVTFSLPASGRGSAIVHFIQDATGEWVVSFPAATEWANSAATDVATDANARTRAVFTQFSSTGVDADLEVRGTVA